MPIRYNRHAVIPEERFCVANSHFERMQQSLSALSCGGLPAVKQLHVYGAAVLL